MGDQTAKQVYEAQVRQIDELVAAGSLSEYDAQEERKSLFAKYSSATLAEAAQVDRDTAVRSAAAVQLARPQAAGAARVAPVKVEEKPTNSNEDRQAELEKLLAHPVVQSRDPEGHAAWLERKNKLLKDEAEG